MRLPTFPIIVFNENTYQKQAYVSRIHIEANSNKSTREILPRMCQHCELTSPSHHGGLGESVRRNGEEVRWDGEEVRRNGEDVRWNGESVRSKWGGSSQVMFWSQNQGYAPSIHLYNLRKKQRSCWSKEVILSVNLTVEVWCVTFVRWACVYDWLSSLRISLDYLNISFCVKNWWVVYFKFYIVSNIDYHV